MEKKINYPTLVADLIQELIDLGYNDKDLVWILTQHGFTEKFIKANYNLPFDTDIIEKL